VDWSIIECDDKGVCFYAFKLFFGNVVYGIAGAEEGDVGVWDLEVG